jgi:hypothetical protein
VKTLVCPGVNCYHLSGGVWLTKRSTMGNIGCRCCRYNGHAVTTMKRVNNRKCWMPLCVFTMLDILFTNPKCILPSHRTVTAAAVLNDLVDETVDHEEYRMPSLPLFTDPKSILLLNTTIFVVRRLAHDTTATFPYKVLTVLQAVCAVHEASWR